MWKRLRERNEWKFFAVLPKADGAPRRRVVAGPPASRRAAGRLRHRHGRCSSRAVQRGDSLVGPLALTGVVFVLLQVLARSRPPSATTSATAPPPGSTTA